MARRRPRLVSEINVVPYIDVMLVLLIIFMITAPMLQQGIEVNLPQAEAQQVDTERNPPLIVSVDRTGALFFTYGTDFVDEAVDDARLMALTRAVLGRKAATPVLVRGDRDVGYGQVVRAMALLKAAGAPKVGLLTEEPEG